MADTVWLLAFCDYDEYTIVGIYDSQALAEAERARVEALQIEVGGRPRLRARRDGHYAVEAFEMNRTGCDVIARVRADGEVRELVVRTGYRSVTNNYEPTYEGIAATPDEAIAAARQRISERPDA